MFNFTMVTISGMGMGFAQAQVRVRVPKAQLHCCDVCTSACAKPILEIVPMEKLHSLIVTLIKKWVIKICQIASFMSAMDKCHLMRCLIAGLIEIHKMTLIIVVVV